MKQTYFNNKQDSIFQAAYNVLTEQSVSTNCNSINEEEDKMSEDEHKQIARDLYKKYGYDAHSIGDFMKELVILKGKFESEKKRKPITNTDKWDEYPDRRPRGDS